VHSLHVNYRLILGSILLWAFFFSDHFVTYFLVNFPVEKYTKSTKHRHLIFGQSASAFFSTLINTYNHVGVWERVSYVCPSQRFRKYIIELQVPIGTKFDIFAANWTDFYIRAIYNLFNLLINDSSVVWVGHSCALHYAAHETWRKFQWLRSLHFGRIYSKT